MLTYYFQRNNSLQYLSSLFCTALSWLINSLVMNVEKNQVETLGAAILSIFH